MPDIKEKLVELLAEFAIDTNGHICDGCGQRSVRDVSAGIANYLIANGVTIQKWISVEERLPERERGIEFLGVPSTSARVLICTESGYINVAFMCEYSESGWTWADEDGTDVRDVVTHWMPLPEPPKGECT